MDKMKDIVNGDILRLVGKNGDVRVVGAEGNQLGIMAAQEGLKLAAAAELDLVIVSRSGSPPVGRIMSFKTLIQERQFLARRRAKQSRKKENTVKDVRIGCRAAVADVERQMRSIESFLFRGHPVRVNVLYRRGKPLDVDAQVGLTMAVVNEFLDEAHQYTAKTVNATNQVTSALIQPGNVKAIFAKGNVKERESDAAGEPSVPSWRVPDPREIATAVAGQRLH